MRDETGDRQSELKGTEKDGRLGLKPESFGWVDVSWEHRQYAQGGEDVDSGWSPVPGACNHQLFLVTSLLSV